MTTPRKSSIDRTTGETSIHVDLDIDGRGSSQIETGLPFFDHMLTLFSKHGLFDLALRASGDLEVDSHHTVEDVGIALGQAFSQALGDRKGIVRYGTAHVPMDETLARAVVDLSGRPFLVYQLPEALGPRGALMSGRDFSLQLVEEFARGFSVHGGMNLHVQVLYGQDPHHLAEAIFKGVARALDQACRIDQRVEGIPSTKGVL